MRIFSGFALLLLVFGFTFVVGSETGVSFYIAAPNETDASDSPSFNLFDYSGYFLLVVFALVVGYFVFGRNRRSSGKKVSKKKSSRARSKKK